MGRRSSKTQEFRCYQDAPMRQFLLSRWRGEVPLSTVLWRDMILVGTALNLLASLAAVGLLIAGASTIMALMVHFGPVPWNVFLFLIVWRCSAFAGTEALLARLTAVIWLVAVTVI